MHQSRLGLHSRPPVCLHCIYRVYAVYPVSCNLFFTFLFSLMKHKSATNWYTSISPNVQGCWELLNTTEGRQGKLCNIFLGNHKSECVRKLQFCTVKNRLLLVRSSNPNMNETQSVEEVIWKHKALPEGQHLISFVSTYSFINLGEACPSV